MFEQLIGQKKNNDKIRVNQKLSKFIKLACSVHELIRNEMLTFMLFFLKKEQKSLVQCH